jgi:hypothetical protein
MVSRLKIRAFAIPVALLLLLVFATTLGTFVHNHSGSSEANCSICHLNHQPIGQPLVRDNEPSMAQVGIRLEVEPPAFPPSLASPRLPARAPPSA